jgi:hypothetical protein
MKLHSNNPSQAPASSTAQHQSTSIQDDVLPATPATLSMTVGRHHSMNEAHLFDETDLTSSQTVFELDGLLDWLMPDFHNTATVPLPMTDFPGHQYPLTSVLGSLASCHDQDPVAETGSGPGKHAIHQIYKLIDDLAKRLNSDLHNTGLTPTFLDACLKEFFGKVSPCFPIIHEPTFSARDCIPPLLLNLVALGSLFVCQTDAASKGEILWRLGHTAVATSWQTLIGLRGPRDRCNGIQLVLTALLGQTYALLSSNANIRTTAFVFHGLGFYWARTSGMYMVEDLPPDSFLTLDKDAESKEEIWRTWAAAEVQRRACLGHYILDGLISQASGSPASARHAINNIGAACSDAAFTAETADDWITAMAATHNGTSRVRLSEVFVQACSKDYTMAPLQLSRFSISVVLEGLQSFVADLDEVSSPALGTVSRAQITRGMLNIYDGNILPLRSSSNSDYLPLLLRWHTVCIELSTPTISLYRRISKTYNLPQVLGGIPVKSWTGPFDLVTWAKSSDAFRSLLHALSITRLLKLIPLGQAHAIHIPGAIFAAAIVMSAVGLWNKNQLDIPKLYRWHDVWADVLVEETQSQRADPADCGAMNFLHSLDPAGTSGTSSVSLIYELNSLQIGLKTVASRWGIAAQMEDNIGRLAMLASGS